MSHQRLLRSDELLRVRLQEIQFTALLANLSVPVTPKFVGSENHRPGMNSRACSHGNPLKWVQAEPK